MYYPLWGGNHFLTIISESLSHSVSNGWFPVNREHPHGLMLGPEVVEFGVFLLSFSDFWKHASSCLVKWISIQRCSWLLLWAWLVSMAEIFSIFKIWRFWWAVLWCTALWALIQVAFHSYLWLKVTFIWGIRGGLQWFYDGRWINHVVPFDYESRIYNHNFPVEA